nr:hypothetical protein [Tanacetum cinerariifolium]
MIVSRVFHGWSSMSNYEHHRLGRLWVVWKQNVRVTPLFKSSQMITCSIFVEGRIEEMLIIFVYALNTPEERKALWEDLKSHKDSGMFHGKPWLICRDFNEILDMEEHSLHDSTATIPEGMSDFQDLVNYCKLYMKDEAIRVKRPFKFSNVLVSHVRHMNTIKEKWATMEPLYHLTSALFRKKYIKQKAKLRWVKHEDQNTKAFHTAVKLREVRNNIREISCFDGSVVSSAEGIKREDERHFHDFMNERPTDFVEWPVSDLKEVLDFQWRNLQNGFTIEFFKDTWDVVGKDLLVAVQSFFQLGFLPKGINSTILTLIPKKKGAKTMKHYRPISCCNVIYKTISKILANRLKVLLPEFITPNQSAFVKDRLLMENLLLVTEIIKDYHKEDITARCAIKIDILKAFDSVQWPFLLNVLKAIDMLDRYIHWINLCISSASFSVQIDKSAKNQHIGLHPGCHDMNLAHLCFVDDLMVLVEGDKQSIEGALVVFDDFAIHFGLSIIIEKSTIYMDGIRDDVQEDILTDFPFEYGTLPARSKNDEGEGLLEILCTPKEGGLGLKSLKDINKVCVLKLIFQIISSKNSLWIDWIKRHLIRNNSFWVLKDNMIAGSWIWKKLLKLYSAYLGNESYRVGGIRSNNSWREQRVHGQEDEFLWRLKDDIYSDRFSRRKHGKSYVALAPIGIVIEGDTRTLVLRLSILKANIGSFGGGLLDSQFTWEWTNILNQISRDAKIDSLFIVRYAFQATIHFLWIERNRRRHGEKPIPNTILVRKIDVMVQNRLSTMQRNGVKNLEDGIHI